MQDKKKSDAPQSRAYVAPEPKNEEDPQFSFSVVCEVPEDQAWFADSGAGRHMCNRRDWYSEYSVLSKKIPVHSASGHTIFAIGSGTVPIDSLVEGKWLSGVLTEVLYVPELSQNLISVGALTDHGYEAKFTHGGMTVYRGDKVVAVGSRRDRRLYKMMCRVAIKEKIQANSADTGAQTIDVWHERFGHANYHTLQEAIKHDSLIGFKVKGGLESASDCRACHMGKQARKTIHPSAKRASDCGELVYFDICGPMSVEGPRGEKWLAVFVDDCSGFLMVIPLKKKSGICKAMETVLIEALVTKHPVQAVQSDNALEFKSEEMGRLLRKHNVQQRFSTPYVPAENGRVERQHRTVVESARSMLHAAQFPKFLWAEACKAAGYIRNRVPLQRLDWKTPYELWHGQRPSVANLRIWGSKGEVFVEESKRDKFDRKTETGSLVGYGHSKSYYMWLSGTMTIKLSRDVSFSETALCVTPVTAGDPGEDLGVFLEAKRTDVTVEKELDEGLPWEPAFVVEECPTTLSEALRSGDAEKWQEAADSEYKSLMRNETWTLVDPPSGANVIKSKWVFRVKVHPNGTVDRYKARLVVKGCSQKSGVDYFDTYSPVTKLTSVRCLLSIAAVHDLEIVQCDVTTAFLYGWLDEDIYMRQPEGYDDQSGRVCKLQKALYGLKQAPLQWNKRITAVLKQLELKAVSADPCVFIRERDGLYFALYVDDGLCIAKSSDVIEEFLTSLEKTFKMTRGSAECFIGIEISRDRQARSIKLNQRGYLKKVLERFSMLDCNPAETPGSIDVVLRKNVDSNGNPKEPHKVPFRQLIGSLLFAAVATRADLAYNVNQLSQFLENPSEDHWRAAKRVLRYIKKTMDLGIVYKPCESPDTLIAYSDSSWASEIDSRKSITGVCLMLNGGIVSWRSKKQSLVADSTMYAEYIAAHACTREVVWFRRLLEGLRLQQTSATVLYLDNAAAESLVVNPVHHERSKHVDIKFHYTREKFASREIRVEHIASMDQLADIFTKILPVKRFETLRRLIGLE